MQHIVPLKAGDAVEIIAPAARTSIEELQALHDLLVSWGLKCVVQPELFGEDLLCANSDANRFALLQRALNHPEHKALICLRGGYGCSRLTPYLHTLLPPPYPKILVGMSDITVLHLFLNQVFGWASIHASMNQAKCAAQDIQSLKNILFGQSSVIHYSGRALNALAEKKQSIETSIIGGNLSLIQCGVGTIWQMQAKGRCIFLEDVGERGYRIDRMLQHISQAGLLEGASALLFGDFTEGMEADGSSRIQAVLERFAQECPCPVIQAMGIGHGYDNHPLPLNTRCTVELGPNIDISVFPYRYGVKSLEPVFK